ncbi:transposase [Dactylosporangium cerinum]|uniref:Transposase n=1 Tax=Dactylosporangium cerinum TaxID=1434730 RepID=A0ABV9WHB5_9ACTN
MATAARAPVQLPRHHLSNPDVRRADPGPTIRRQRRSQPLQHLLHGIGAALAGRAGVRLAARPTMDVSRSTLPRLLRNEPEQALTVAPRVLGVDDFALRRGQVYATILLDMETHRPVDVLPDREADTLAAWLQAHPGTEIICRDRAGAYADGARTGAPNAIQVADRWHVWRNLGEAVEAIVVAHRASLHEPPAKAVTPPKPEHAAEPLQFKVLPGKEIRLVTRTRERYTQIQQLLADGASRREVGRRLGLDPQTVRRFADAASIDDLLANTRRETLLDGYKTYLHQRWNDGCTDTATLHGELRGRGYRGSVQTLRRYLQPLRPAGFSAAPGGLGWLIVEQGMCPHRARQPRQPGCGHLAGEDRQVVVLKSGSGDASQFQERGDFVEGEQAVA